MMTQLWNARTLKKKKKSEVNISRVPIADSVLNIYRVIEQGQAFRVTLLCPWEKEQSTDLNILK